MSALDHQLRNVMQVLTTAVTMLPTEKSPDGVLIWLDLLEDAADRCERVMERLDATGEDDRVGRSV